MQLDLIHNGHHLQRKKLYPTNPRNNLISTVDIIWRQSLQDQRFLSTKKLQNRKLQETQLIKNQYAKLIEKQIQEQMRMDKSSFRVIPIQKQYNRYDDRNQRRQQNINNNSNLFTSRRSSVPLRDYQIQGYSTNQQQKRVYNSQTKKFISSQQILNPTTNSNKTLPQLKSSGMLSKTVFGYQINPQNFKRQSYLSKVLSDRLSPYLQTSNQNCRRHKSISAANNIVDLNY